jgi:cyclic beta-1,2-glucan glucanotransferase
VPASWSRYQMRLRHGSTTYEIEVENPERRNRGVARTELDGARLDEATIPLLDDGRTHRVRVVMGEPPVPAEKGVGERTLSSPRPG